MSVDGAPSLYTVDKGYIVNNAYRFFRNSSTIAHLCTGDVREDLWPAKLPVAPPCKANERFQLKIVNDYLNKLIR